MAPADRLATRRPGRRHPLARGDGAEDAAGVNDLSAHTGAVEWMLNEIEKLMAGWCVTPCSASHPFVPYRNIRRHKSHILDSTPPLTLNFFDNPIRSDPTSV